MKTLARRTNIPALLLLWAALLSTAAAQQAEPTPEPTPARTAVAPAAPLSYGLVVDNSGSLREHLSDVIGAAKTIIEANAPGDEAFVVRFVSSDKIEVVRDFTASGQALGRALDDMFVEGGQSAVVDAVYTSAEHLAQRVGPDASRRRALILLTDGEDRASFYTQGQLMTFLRERKIPVYVLAFPASVKKDRGRLAHAKALALIKTLAEESGGRAVVVEEMSELASGAAELVKHIRQE